MVGGIELLETKGKGKTIQTMLFAMGKLDGKVDQLSRSLHQQLEGLDFNIRRLDRKLGQLDERVTMLSQKMSMFKKDLLD